MSISARVFHLFDYLLIIMHSLVIVLIIGQGRLVFHPLLEVLGRMHPLLLHFPIVLLILAAFLYWFPDSGPSPIFRKKLLLIALLFTGLTVVAGFLLSSEPGYSYENFKFHQWTAVSVFWLASVWYWIDQKENFYTLKLLPVTSSLLIVITGHLGASITHGEDFLLEPLNSPAKQVQVSLEEAEAFNHIIKPILEQKCISCHKASKQKGELRLDEAKYIMAGGKTGLSIDLKNPKESLLLKRIHLPLEDDEHMPPKGKVQLNDQEKQLLETWILASSPMDKKVVDFNTKEQFFTLAKNWVESRQTIHYDFEAAKPKIIKSLNDEYRLIEPISPQSPALAVRFFGKNQFNSDRLQELEKIGEKIVYLNLSHLDLNDEDLKVIGGFKNLENLNLNFTGLDGTSLDHLANLPNLQKLSISGNPLKAETLNRLKKIHSLQVLYIWNTKISDSEIDHFLSLNQKITIERGYKDDAGPIALNAPIIEFDNPIFKQSKKISLKHPIGSVRIHYTLDGTKPDSLHSPIYQEPILLHESSTIQARAFAPGWIGSPINQAVVFKSGIIPDEIELSYDPDEKYKGKGAQTLFDLEKGDEDFASGKWLGFQKQPLEAILEFTQVKTINNIALSLLTDEGSHIFPPSQIEIAQKNPDGNWEIIYTEKPEQPKENLGKQMLLKTLGLEKAMQTEAVKIRVIPLAALPSWHPSKGSKAWVFIDEILIN
ncbi:c-type cytochrome domain-containing protein [Indibacter alkaliphilus]|uniref:c-type cytochrome domain-containing protein n=1 Tax=Indibacter alkaliphilus TaxID=579922 RepID=UPI0002821B74|nr:c-type cytochrome domain-containing protein [Indibacter alkaliphilus]